MLLYKSVAFLVTFVNVNSTAATAIRKKADNVAADNIDDSFVKLHSIRALQKSKKNKKKKSKSINKNKKKNKSKRKKKNKSKNKSTAASSESPTVSPTVSSSVAPTSFQSSSPSISFFPTSNPSESCETWSAGINCDSSDACALLSIFTALNGCNWISREGWFYLDNVCDWFGITCLNTDGSNKITEINLPRNNLNGPVPTDVANLINLVRIDFSSNVLTGKIPTQLASLSSLSELLLYDNNYDNPTSAEDGVITDAFCYNATTGSGVATITADCAFPYFVSCPLDCCQCTNTAPSSTPTFPPSVSLNPSTNPSFVPSTAPTCNSSLDESICVTSPDKDSCEALLQFYEDTKGCQWEVGSYSVSRHLQDKVAWGTDEDYCRWEGLECDSNISSSVKAVSLVSNSLNGNMDALCGLKNLTNIALSNNIITGPFPVCLTELEALTQVSVTANQFDIGTVANVMCELNLEVFETDCINNYFVECECCTNCGSRMPPSQYPSSEPTITTRPSLSLSRTLSDVPSQIPSAIPTHYPSESPTVVPTNEPTKVPMSLPSEMPSLSPTDVPTVVPTNEPTEVPTSLPSEMPSLSPTESPTDVPTVVPTNEPTKVPTSLPTNVPTTEPSAIPSGKPTEFPSTLPTFTPTLSVKPSMVPSLSNRPSSVPSLYPSLSAYPSTSSVPSISSAPSMDCTSTTCDDMIGLTALNQSLNIGWAINGSTNKCDLDGVTCDDSNNYVKSISLSQKSLNGNFLGCVRSLCSLQTLSLNYNGIYGTIPSEIGTLSSLIYLSLHQNSFGGAIPTEIGLLSSLWNFDLSDNSITGTIPTEIGLLSSLVNSGLHLSSNKLTGTIPTEIGLLSYSLRDMSFDFNSLGGTLPTELGMLPNLWLFSVSDNSIGGTLPSEIGLMTSLNYMTLTNNSIGGMIPTEVVDCCTTLSSAMILLENNSNTLVVPTDLCTSWRIQVDSSAKTANC